MAPVYNNGRSLNRCTAAKSVRLFGALRDANAVLAISNDGTNSLEQSQAGTPKLYGFLPGGRDLHR